MGQAARLMSIDAVEEMAAALEVFRGEASAALDELEMEIRRALDWIHHDRHEHWDHEVRHGWERISEARVQLHQAMTARRIDERDPSCVDEKRALERAKRRLDVAQHKVEAVRHWTRVIDHAITEYRGIRALTSGWLDTELPRALAALKRMTAALEIYVAAPPAAGMAPLSRLPEDSEVQPSPLPEDIVVQPSRLPEAGETPAPQTADAGETPAPQPPEAAP